MPLFFLYQFLLGGGEGGTKLANTDIMWTHWYDPITCSILELNILWMKSELLEHNKYYIYMKRQEERQINSIQTHTQL